MWPKQVIFHGSVLAAFVHTAWTHEDSNLERRQISVVSTVALTASRAFSTASTQAVSNTTDEIDLNSSWLNDVAVTEGGDSSDPALIQLAASANSSDDSDDTSFTESSGSINNLLSYDPSMTSKSRLRHKRATTLPNGGRSIQFTANETNDFNITFSPCVLDWGQVVGRWTFFNHSTRDYVTMLDIYRDVCDKASLPYNNGRQLSNPKYNNYLSGLIAVNAQLGIAEAQSNLDQAIGNYSLDHPTPSDPFDHSELRKLLELPSSHWVVVVTGSVVGGLITSGLTWSASSGNDTAWQIASTGVNTFCIILLLGCLQAYGNHRHMQDVDKKLASMAVSAGRQTVHTISNAGTRIAETVQHGSENALNSLRGSAQNLLHMGATALSNENADPLDPNSNPPSIAVSPMSSGNLESIVINHGIQTLRETSITGAGITTLETAVESFRVSQDNGGSCV